MSFVRQILNSYVAQWIRGPEFNSRNAPMFYLLRVFFTSAWHVK
jgi:hypothetical protein